jgi:hypothetical protein
MRLRRYLASPLQENVKIIPKFVWNLDLPLASLPHCLGAVGWIRRQRSFSRRRYLEWENPGRAVFGSFHSRLEAHGDFAGRMQWLGPVDPYSLVDLECLRSRGRRTRELP